MPNTALNQFICIRKRIVCSPKYSKYNNNNNANGYFFLSILRCDWRGFVVILTLITIMPVIVLASQGNYPTFRSYLRCTVKRWLNTFRVTTMYVSTPSTVSLYMPRNWGSSVLPWHSTINWRQPGEESREREITGGTRIRTQYLKTAYGTAEIGAPTWWYFFRMLCISAMSSLDTVLITKRWS